MSQLEIIRNLLLVSLLAMLIYVMYKRLIHLMQKQHTMAKYPSLDAACTWDGSMVYLGMTIEQKMEIEVVAVCDESQWSQSIFSGSVDSGHHNYGLETVYLPAGKYHFQITTPHEKAMRYFHVS
jgi:hypothetical protein